MYRLYDNNKNKLTKAIKRNKYEFDLNSELDNSKAKTLTELKRTKNSISLQTLPCIIYGTQSQ